MHVEYAQLPPPENSADRIFITENAVIVLDGATAFVPVAVSAQTYANHLGRTIAAELTSEPGSDLRDALAGAIRRTATDLQLSPHAAPSSTVSIVRKAPTSLDLLVLGDSPVLWGRSTEWRVLRDDRLQKLRLPERDRYRARLRAGHGFDDEHRALLRELQEGQAKRRNIEGGYWIAETDPLAAENALVASVEPIDFDWALIVTDGAFDLLDQLDCTAWPDVGQYDGDELSQLLSGLNSWENDSDPQGVQFPRSKLHDDKTIATITFDP
jgi:hypothetical protein